jgi:hypothetical protein
VNENERSRAAALLSMKATTVFVELE